MKFSVFQEYDIIYAPTLDSSKKAVFYDKGNSGVFDERPSFNKYGGYEGFDDDVIDSAFEGDPTAVWNID